MTLGEKIKLLRTEKGMTQESFAEKLNVSRSAIAKWESDNGIPEISNLKLVSQIFGISLDELLDNEKVATSAEITNTATEFRKSNYTGYYCDIDLTGWNDGVSKALILGEDDDFVFYKKSAQDTGYGLLGKKYITTVEKCPKMDVVPNCEIIDRGYFCGKHVSIDPACHEGFFKGFFDFRSDDYLDVVIKGFDNSKVVLEFGRSLDIDGIAKIEER